VLQGPILGAFILIAFVPTASGLRRGSPSYASTRQAGERRAPRALAAMQ
jgi:hypothetical protein